MRRAAACRDAGSHAEEPGGVARGVAAMAHMVRGEVGNVDFAIEIPRQLHGEAGVLMHIFAVSVAVGKIWGPEGRADPA